jgi:hypothetical protein
MTVQIASPLTTESVTPPSTAGRAISVLESQGARITYAQLVAVKARRRSNKPKA